MCLRHKTIENTNRDNVEVTTTFFPFILFFQTRRSSLKPSVEETDVSAQTIENTNGYNADVTTAPHQDIALNTIEVIEVTDSSTSTDNMKIEAQHIQNSQLDVQR